MDKVDYNALIELVRQAQQSTDLPQQTTLLTPIHGPSGLVFAEASGSKCWLWQLRAVSSHQFEYSAGGFRGRAKTLAAGAADSNDPKLQQLLAKLKLLGWMDKPASRKRCS